MLNSTRLRKNCSRSWSWPSPPCTENASHGLPSRNASVGVRVTRGRLPGATTLNGFSASSTTKLCMRCERPTPVLPAITAGTHPPEGVIDTTQPSLSAVLTEVVPAKNGSDSLSLGPLWSGTWGGRRPGRGSAIASGVPPCSGESLRSCQRLRIPANGLVAFWNGYGSPGAIFGSFFEGFTSFARSFAYSFESRPAIGSAGGKYGSP